MKAEQIEIGGAYLATVSKKTIADLVRPGPVGVVRHDKYPAVPGRKVLPRDEGRILIGSTEEEVDFDKQTTTSAGHELRQFACSLAPTIGAWPTEHHWSGLRPATTDGLPYLGRVPGYDNAWLATGHYRGGLQLSSGTAVVISALIRGAEAPVDISALGVDRHETANQSA